MKDYRKIYADYYCVEWDSKLFEVHHIDRNRENNDVHNLVLLPKKLHREYHKIICVVENSYENINDVFNIGTQDSFYSEKMKRLFEIKSDMMAFWVIQNEASMLYSEELIEANYNIAVIIKKFLPTLYAKYIGE